MQDRPWTGFDIDIYILQHIDCFIARRPQNHYYDQNVSPFSAVCALFEPIDRHHKGKKLDPNSGSAVLEDPLGVLIRGDLVMKVSLVLTSHSKLEFAFTN